MTTDLRAESLPIDDYRYSIPLDIEGEQTNLLLHSVIKKSWNGFSFVPSFKMIELGVERPAHEEIDPTQEAKPSEIDLFAMPAPVYKTNMLPEWADAEYDAQTSVTTSDDSKLRRSTPGAFHKTGENYLYTAGVLGMDVREIIVALSEVPYENYSQSNRRYLSNEEYLLLKKVILYDMIHFANELDEKGIPHYDLAEKNLILRLKDGKIIYIDYGLAKLDEETFESKRPNLLSIAVRSDIYKELLKPNQETPTDETLRTVIDPWYANSRKEVLNVEREALTRKAIRTYVRAKFERKGWQPTETLIDKILDGIPNILAEAPTVDYGEEWKMTMNKPSES
jgi:tRNA A-37 threonylcarbamoyl transferase component Bud32